MDENVGMTFDGFRVEERLGSGGEGTVYRAVCVEPRFGLEPGTTVALKMMSVADHDGRRWRRLSKRTQELVLLQHRNVVRYHGCFHVSKIGYDLQFVVQEFLHGETLKQRLERCKWGLEVEEGLSVISGVLDGLIYTTANGIVHRDIKPSNIFICTDRTVKLVDFEIAKRETISGDATTTATTNLRGSFDYLAPEFRDSKFFGDARSDVFSLGVVMHEVLTGKKPYPSEQASSIFAFLDRYGLGEEKAQSPITIDGRIRLLVGESGAQVLQNALAISRDGRYVDFVQFKEAFRNVRPYMLRSRYQVMQLIGKGGFGEVFKAYDHLKGKFVAIKHLFDAANEKKFRKEARAMQKLDDSNFVQFVDCFKGAVDGDHSDSSLYLVMDFLEGMPGSSLSDIIHRVRHGEQIPLPNVLIAFDRYARGLQRMHAEDLSHRDIKPANLYYQREHPERAVIMDLGIVHDVKGSITDGVKGTPDYISPEVVLLKSKGEGPGDVYALGLCLYEALTGRKAYPPLPKEQHWLYALRERVGRGERPTFELPRNIECRKELLALLRGMTELKPAKRYSASKVVHEIQNIQRRLLGIESTFETYGATDTVTFTITDSVWRRPLIWTAAGVAGLCVVLAVVIGWPIAKVKFAKSKLKSEVVPAYQRLESYNGTDILEEESRWMARFGPRSDSLLRLSPKDFSECSAILETVKSELLERSLPVTGEKRTGWVEFFPNRERGVICLFKDQEFKSQTNVVLEAGDYQCTYRNLSETNGVHMFRATTLKFTVKANSPVSVPAPVKWDMTLEYKTWLKDHPPPLPVQVESPVNMTRHVKCEVDGKAWTNGFSLLPREQPYECIYRRDDGEYFAQTNTFTVTNSMRPMRLPPVGEWEKFPPPQTLVQVELPENMTRHVICDVDGKVWTNGFSLLPREQPYECIYRRDDGKYFAQTNTFTVTNGMRIVRLPPVDEWEQIPPPPKPKPDPQRSKEIVDQCKELMALEPVSLRRQRLEEAKRTRQKAIDQNQLTDDDAEQIESEIQGCEKLIVGIVSNASSRQIEVAGRQIAPGVSELFVFTNSVPSQWNAVCKGFERRPLDHDFEGRKLTITDDYFTARRVRVKIPPLSDDVVCEVNKDEVSNHVSARVGDSLQYSYRRPGYVYTGNTVYEVTDTDQQTLPLPEEKDWRIKPVKVVVEPIVEVTCSINGQVVKEEIVEYEPGTTLECIYLRDGYPPWTNTYTVTSDNYKTIPPPDMGKWKPLPVSVSVKLPQGVTCWFEGKSVQGAVQCEPNGEISLTFKRPGFVDIERSYWVTKEKDQVVYAPEGWNPQAVQVSLPKDWPDGVTCWIDGQLRSFPLSRKPKDRMVCVYRRSGYKDVRKEYDVTPEERQLLPKPADSEWERMSVQVWVPRLMDGVSCRVDGDEVPVGTAVEKLPGSKLVYSYLRPGFKPVQKEYTVGSGGYQELPSPTYTDWERLKVDVAIERSQRDVTCWFKGKIVQDPISCEPDQEIQLTFKRPGYADVNVTYPVTDKEEQIVSTPTNWVTRPVQVQLPVLLPDVECRVGGRLETFPLSRKPQDKISYVYKRVGFEDIPGEYEVTTNEVQKLPEPKAWIPKSVTVWIPDFEWPGISCIIDGQTLHSGDHVERVPGVKIEFFYRRSGYEDMPMPSYKVPEISQYLPKPDKIWKPLLVRVEIPDLRDGVTLWIGGVQQTGTITAKPGKSLDCTYKRSGYQDVTKTHIVSSDVDQKLPGPDESDWVVQPVQVTVPNVGEGIEISVDGREVSPGAPLSLQPGQYTCKYARPDYEPQKKTVTISHDVPVSWPMPGEWIELGGIKFISEAEKALKDGDREKAQELLKRVPTDLSPKNEERVRKISSQIEILKTQAGRVKECVETAKVSYEDEEWSNVLKNFAEAADAGYLLTNSDWEMVEEAYPKATEPPRVRIKEWEKWWKTPEFLRGPRPPSDEDRAKAELKEMEEWYQKCKNARR